MKTLNPGFKTHVISDVDKVHGKLAYTVEYVIPPDGNASIWHVARYACIATSAATRTQSGIAALLGELAQRAAGDGP